jgi:hypothetical protein
MSTIQQSRRRFSGIIAVLAFTLLAPVAVTAQDAVTDPAAWAENSGHNALEANRAAASSLVLASAEAFGAASGYDGLEEQRVAYWASISAPQSGDAARVAMARQALDSGDIGGMQEEALTAIVEASSAEVER